MLIGHGGHAPRVHPSAYVAPAAVLCGAVHVGPGARILLGAVLRAEDGEVGVGARSVVMENARSAGVLGFR
jgi:carbonic anhydrase/acetyltransferase-like protein (isoleucine patch superfamily)